MKSCIPLIVAALFWTSCFSEIDGQDRTNSWPAGTKSLAGLGIDRAYTYEFSDISVARLQWWLDAVRIELPVRLDGELSGWLWIQRSADGWLDFQNYRIEARINSASLQIEEWLVSDADLRFGYAAGNWYVGRLGGNVKSPTVRRSVGSIDLDAMLLTASTSDLDFTLKIDGVDLHELLSSLGIKNAIGRSAGQVQVVGKLPLDEPADLTSWDVQAKAEVGELELPWIVTSTRGSISLVVADGRWQLTDGSLVIANEEVGITGRGSLSDDFAFELAASVDKIELSQLIRQLKQTELAKRLSGVVRFRSQLEGNRKVGLSLASVSIASENATFDTSTLQGLSSKAIYTPEKFLLEIESAKLAAGSLEGRVEWESIAQVATAFPETSRLKINDVQLDKINLPAFLQLEPVSSFGGLLNATFSSDMDSSAENKRLETYGQIEIKNLTVGENRLGNLVFDWKQNDSTDNIPASLSLSKDKGSLEAKVVIALHDLLQSENEGSVFKQFTLQGKFTDYPLEFGLNEAAVSPVKARILGTFQAKGAPDLIGESGSLNLSNSKIWIADELVDIEHAEVSFDEREFRLDRMQLVHDRGRISGGATISRDGSRDSSLKVNVSQLRLMPLLEDFFPGPFERFDGLANLEVQLNKPKTDTNLWTNWVGTFQVSFTEIQFSQFDLGELQATGKVGEQQITLSGDGKLLSGETKVSAVLPYTLAVADSEPSKPGKLDVEVKQFELKRLTQLLGFGTKTTQSPEGKATLQLNAFTDSSKEPVLKVHLETPLVRQNRKSIVQKLAVDLQYKNGELVVEQIVGGFANGRVDVKGRLALANTQVGVERGRLNITAQRLNIKTVLNLIDPELTDSFQGKVGFRGSLSFGRDLLLAGHLRIDDGVGLGIPFQELRGRIRTSFDKSLRFQRVESNNLHGKMFGGDLDAELKLTGGSRIAAAANGTVTNANLEQLSEYLGFQKVFGHGVFGGRFETRWKDIAKVKTMEGEVGIKFKKSDSRSIPLISTLDRFVPLVPFASTDIEDGFLKARFGSGNLQISELNLMGKAFMLAANGDIALDGSRLDLETIVFTGGNIPQQLVQSSIQKVVVRSIPQLAAVVEINNLLRNRTVFLHVGGTPSRPTIRPIAGETVITAFVQNLTRGSIGQSAQWLQRLDKK